MRDAIDLHFDVAGTAEVRARAGAALLAMSDDGPGEDWARVKAEFADDLDARVH